MNCVYFIENTKTKHFKIGRTKNVQARIKQLQTGNENHIMLRKQIVCDSKIEKMIHRYFEEQKIKSEWFNISIIQVYEVCKVIKLALLFRSRKILEVSDNNMWLNNYFKNNIDNKMILLREILQYEENSNIQIASSCEEDSHSIEMKTIDTEPLITKPVEIKPIDMRQTDMRQTDMRQIELENVGDAKPNIYRDMGKQIETIYCCNIL